MENLVLLTPSHAIRYSFCIMYLLTMQRSQTRIIVSLCWRLLYVFPLSGSQIHNHRQTIQAAGAAKQTAAGGAEQTAGLTAQGSVPTYGLTCPAHRNEVATIVRGACNLSLLKVLRQLGT